MGGVSQRRCDHSPSSKQSWTGAVAIIIPIFTQEETKAQLGDLLKVTLAVDESARTSPSPEFQNATISQTTTLCTKTRSDLTFVAHCSVEFHKIPGHQFPMDKAMEGSFRVVVRVTQDDVNGALWAAVLSAPDGCRTGRRLWLGSWSAGLEFVSRPYSRLNPCNRHGASLILIDAPCSDFPGIVGSGSMQILTN